MEQSECDKRALNRLKARASFFGCGRYLMWVDEITRQQIYNTLECQRLERKYRDILDCYYKQAGENWHQTLFIYLFRYLGDPKNKAAYVRLARMVGYNAILRERLKPMSVEALLLGASGLLKEYHDDHYTSVLKREASYLMRKYNITPMHSSDWSLKVYPHNNPVLRLAQAATLFSQSELFLDKVLECRCIEDIEDIFQVEASEYWTNHYVPVKHSTSEVKRLGGGKCNILGINLVVMIQHAYGSYTANDELLDRSQNLIQDLKVESNWIINRWRNHGLRPQNAFEGQALIELATQYCQAVRCEQCFVAARAVENFSWLDQEEL